MFSFEKLPNEDIPFMEPHLRALYFQTYFLLAEGFYNASLVLMGILLENIIKEKLFMEGVSDTELEGNFGFGKAISKCKTMNLLLKEELDFLEDKKDKLRNPYAHYNKMKLSEGIYCPMWEIKNPVEKLISLQERVNSGEITEADARKELIRGVPVEAASSKEFRPLAHLVKTEIDKNQAIDVFLEIDKFVKEFAVKYFKPKEK